MIFQDVKLQQDHSDTELMFVTIHCQLECLTDILGPESELYTWTGQTTNQPLMVFSKSHLCSCHTSDRLDLTFSDIVAKFVDVVCIHVLIIIITQYLYIYKHLSPTLCIYKTIALMIHSSRMKPSKCLRADYLHNSLVCLELYTTAAYSTCMDMHQL